MTATHLQSGLDFFTRAKVKGKGQGVLAKVDVPKGKCLPVYGLEIPDDPYPEDTRYILDVGKKDAL